MNKNNMKKFVSNYLIIATVAFSAIFTSCKEKEVAKEPSLLTETAENTDNRKLLENGKESGNVKLLESITDDNGNVIAKFEYDEQNRIVKIDDKMITYDDNLVTVGNKKFVIKDSTVTVGKETLILNKDGYLVSRKDPNRTGIYEDKKGKGNFKECAYLEKYEYQDGNLTQETDNSGDIELFYGTFRNYQYDSKQSPFSNCNTPKWLLQYLVEPYYASKNNVIACQSGGGDYHIPTVYKYEYDSDGFPTKLTIELAKDYDGDDIGGVNGTVIHFTYRGETKSNASVKIVGGTYSFEIVAGSDMSGSLLVYPLNNNAALFYLCIFRSAPSYNSGELWGEMTIENNVGIYKFDDENGNCLLTFKFSAGQVEITTDEKCNNCGFGHGVYADHIYKLINKSIPEYYINRQDDTVRFKDLKFDNK
jgi:hypothetical protein